MQQGTLGDLRRIGRWSAGRRITPVIRRLGQPLSVVLAGAGLLLAGCGGGGDADEPGQSFVTWSNSANGEVILDANGEQFRVNTGSRQVVDRSGAQLSGLVVDGSANVTRNGGVIGYVGAETATTGRQIAALKCSNGTRMDLTVAASGWTHQCGTAGTSPASVEDAPTGGGSVSSTSTQASYTTWNGSANGEVVLDANNNRFRVRTGDGALVASNNSVLSGMRVTGSTLSFNGSPIGSVSLAPGANGGSVAVFSCTRGYLAIDVTPTAFTYSCQGQGSSIGTPTLDPGVPHITVGGTSGSTSGGTTPPSTTGGAGTDTTPAPQATFVKTLERWERTASGQTQVYAVYLRNTSSARERCTVQFSYQRTNNLASSTRGFLVYETAYHTVVEALSPGSTGRFSTPVVTDRLTGSGILQDVETQIKDVRYEIHCRIE